MSQVLEFVEDARETTTQSPEAPPMTPRDELRLLEKKALENKIPREIFEKIQNIGDCELQVQTRIDSLHEWLAAH